MRKSSRQAIFLIRSRLAISKKYPNRPITLAERLTRNSAVTYEIRLKNRGKTVELVYDPSGKQVHD